MWVYVEKNFFLHKPKDWERIIRGKVKVQILSKDSSIYYYYSITLFIVQIHQSEGKTMLNEANAYYCLAHDMNSMNSKGNKYPAGVE